MAPELMRRWLSLLARYGTPALVLMATLAPQGTAGTRTVCVMCGGAWLGDAILNVVMFVPLGFLWAPRTSLRRTVFVAIAFSLTIEALQLTIGRGRYSSPLDVASNAAGAWLGYLTWSACQAWRRGDRVHCTWVGRAVAAAWSVQCAMTAWGLRPYVPSVPLIGQWAHVFPGYAPLGAEIRQVTAHGFAVPDGNVDSSAAILREARLKGLALEAVVSAVPRSEPISQVAALIDGPTHRMLSISVSGCNILGRSGTNSERVGLSTPRIALPDGCQARETRIMLTQDGRNLALIVADGDRKHRKAILRLRPVVGWTMLLPLATSPRTRGAATLAWGMAFSFAAAVFAARAGGRRSTVRILVALVLAVYLAAMIWETSLPTILDLLAIVAGTLMGMLAARLPGDTPGRGGPFA